MFDFNMHAWILEPAWPQHLLQSRVTLQCCLSLTPPPDCVCRFCQMLFVHVVHCRARLSMPLTTAAVAGHAVQKGQVHGGQGLYSSMV